MPITVGTIFPSILSVGSIKFYLFTSTLQLSKLTISRLGNCNILNITKVLSILQLGLTFFYTKKIIYTIQGVFWQYIYLHSFTYYYDHKFLLTDKQIFCGSNGGHFTSTGHTVWQISQSQSYYKKKILMKQTEKTETKSSRENLIHLTL